MTRILTVRSSASRGAFSCFPGSLPPSPSRVRVVAESSRCSSPSRSGSALCPHVLSIFAISHRRRGAVGLASRGPRDPIDVDFADEIADKVEKRVRASLKDGLRWDERDSQRVAESAAETAERAVRGALRQPGQALLAGGALLMGMSMLLGPLMGVLAIAGAGVSFGILSSVALGATAAAVAFGFAALALGLVSSFALPLIAPFLLLGAGFLGLRALTSQPQPASQQEAKGGESTDPLRKQQMEEEQRRRDIQDELDDFDDMLKRRGQRGGSRHGGRF